MTVSIVSIPANEVPKGATLVYRGALHKVVRVENADNESKWVKFFENLEDGSEHIIYRRAGQMVDVRATKRTKALVDAA